MTYLLTNHPYLAFPIIGIGMYLLNFILHKESDYRYNKRREKIWKKELEGNNPYE